MTKKCDCKKCIHCKQIVTSTAIFRVTCKKYGEDKFKPTYCDQYTTKEEISSPKIVKQLAEFFAVPQRIIWDELTNNK